MIQKSRWKWGEMPDYYNANYYNEKDYAEGKTFVIIDTITGKEYIYPQIEKRKDENGNEYNQRVISSDLWNQEFMYWACSTSPDFAIYIGKDWMTPEMLEILVTTPQNPLIFSRIPETKLNKELCQKAFATNPNVYTVLPDKYLTLEMTQFYVNLPNPSFYAIPKKMRTAEIFRKVYNNSTSQKRVELIKGNKYRGNSYDIDYITKEIADDVLQLDITTINKIPSKFVSEEHSKKAIEADGGYLEFVPVQYRTKDLCEKAFNNNPAGSIEFIPSQFHTLEMHEKVIDIKPIYVGRIPEDVLSDEIIYYAISKSAAALGGIPEERRTEEICAYATNISLSAFSHIPRKYRTYDICLKAVIFNPKLIKKVPVEILNQQFIDAVKSANVIIPNSAMGYVKECLSVHEKLGKEDLSAKTNAGKYNGESPEEIEGEFTKISLEDIPGFFTPNVITLLYNNGIITIGDLLAKATQSNFVFSLGNKSIVNEILGAVNLLRCKYLDEDPLVEENDELDMDTISKKFGFTTRTANSLRRGGFNSEYTDRKFFELMRNTNMREELLFRLRNMGKNSVAEIINKTQIVLDYHDRHQKKQESETSQTGNPKLVVPNNEGEETLESLNEELIRLRLEIQRLNDRTDVVLAKIQQKMKEQSKGGVLK